MRSQPPQTIVTEDAEGRPAFVTVYPSPGVSVEHVPPEQPPAELPAPAPLPMINVIIRRQRIRLLRAYGSSLVQPRLPAGSILVLDEHLVEQLERDSPGVAEVIDPQVDERTEPMPRLDGMVGKRVTWDEYMSYEPPSAAMTPAIGL